MRSLLLSPRWVDPIVSGRKTQFLRTPRCGGCQSFDVGRTDAHLGLYCRSCGRRGRLSPHLPEGGIAQAITRPLTAVPAMCPIDGNHGRMIRIDFPKGTRRAGEIYGSGCETCEHIVPAAFAMLRGIRARVVSLAELAEPDAVAEGFESADALRRDFHRYAKRKVSPDQVIELYDFTASAPEVLRHAR